MMVKERPVLAERPLTCASKSDILIKKMLSAHTSHEVARVLIERRRNSLHATSRGAHGI